MHKAVNSWRYAHKCQVRSAQIPSCYVVVEAHCSIATDDSDHHNQLSASESEPQPRLPLPAAGKRGSLLNILS